MELNSYQNRSKMNNYEAWSCDKTYGIRIAYRLLEKMLAFCKVEHGIEVGGILVGYYNQRHDCAIVTDCSGPPKDSICERSRFRRGIRGLQEWIMKLWNLNRRRYYLGEWHFHPFSNPEPSSVDVTQIKKNSETKSYQCPEPIMFILGGSPDRDWTCKSFVYVKKTGLIELKIGWEK